ncbi:hypothetical protein UA08_03910 [Talaromyces atroroseus]|uniref:DUF7707 domain-containing protein n=1 Tax=Talaromyces atroroseus TaxID=1441469 RepID=A0A225AIV5_TALAT|nr:hypothetical protein UA08_03910 [Talaromyces atroroseus]OKL60810.1 hypothetical protein UA08_03910 [Talaromyces atroroseus]
MRSSAVLIFAALVAHAAADYNYTFPSGFDLSDVSATELEAWCQGERNTCPEVCGGAASSNTCDSTTLDFSCTCANGTTPDLSPYENTIPFYVCQETYIQCINNNPNDLQAQDNCKANATCGTIILGASSTTSSSSSSSASSTSSSTLVTTTASVSATGSSTGSATGSSATSASSTGAAVALQIAQDHSTGFFAAALLAVFGMLL